MRSPKPTNASGSETGKGRACGKGVRLRRNAHLIEVAGHAQLIAGGLEARGQLASARVRAAGEQAVDPLVQVGGEVEAELDGEVEGLAGRDAGGQRRLREELVQHALRRVHRPLLR
ncbi:MAG TPA: hypothetical protein VFE45_07925 [Coriobacteriia bacterium]|nr:hypothetical protein [Coriobacteriia bacterium]